MLRAIARALRLDDAEESHLLDLAAGPQGRPLARRARTWPQASLVRLFQAMPVAAATELRHPWVGRLTVNQRALTGLGHTNVYLLLATAEPGSGSAERLRELSRLAQLGPDR